jgi:hypothetical protein
LFCALFFVYEKVGVNEQSSSRKKKKGMGANKTTKGD